MLFYIEIRSFMFITVFIYSLCIGEVNVKLILILSPLINNEYFGINNAYSLHVRFRFVMLVSSLLLYYKRLN
jgi:hypothetical protein